MICRYCKKSFKENNTQRKYCTQSCYWKAKAGSTRQFKRKKELICLECKMHFMRYFSDLQRNNSGKYCSRKCLGKANGRRLSGKGHWNWKGGISPRVLNTIPYKEWRKKVFERDNYVCIMCGYNGGRIIQADHIKSWKNFPELRFDVKNGRTLCIECHKKTPTYGHH